MKFLGKIPTVWDETIILDAKLGKYIVELRRNGKDWYLAAMNNWESRSFDVPLGFLKDGRYLVESASDGINAARNPEDYKMRNSVVNASDTLTVKLAPGGGFVARISH
jgi:alpha-glucosidase